MEVEVAVEVEVEVAVAVAVAVEVGVARRCCAWCVAVRMVLDELRGRAYLPKVGSTVR